MIFSAPKTPYGLKSFLQDFGLSFFFLLLLVSRKISTLVTAIYSSEYLKPIGRSKQEIECWRLE